MKRNPNVTLFLQLQKFIEFQKFPQKSSNFFSKLRMIFLNLFSKKKKKKKGKEKEYLIVMTVMIHLENSQNLK